MENEKEVVRNIIALKGILKMYNINVIDCYINSFKHLKNPKNIRKLLKNTAQVLLDNPCAREMDKNEVFRLCREFNVEIKNKNESSRLDKINKMIINQKHIKKIRQFEKTQDFKILLNLSKKKIDYNISEKIFNYVYNQESDITELTKIKAKALKNLMHQESLSETLKGKVFNKMIYDKIW